jgi:hypothetical protein
MRRSPFRSVPISLLLLSLLASSSGCSVYKAATQPGPADLTGLGVGTRRGEVITRLGAPKFSDTSANGHKEDTFEFQSGLHQASKARIIPYLAADLFTLGLAELILWPMELTIMESATCVAHIEYDATQRVNAISMVKKNGVQNC